MSHIGDTTSTGASVVPVGLQIVNYATGGEAVTVSEFGLPGLVAVLFAQVHPSKNSLGVMLFPVLLNAKILLFQLSGGVFTEIATTANLNASVSAIVIIPSF